LNPRTLSGRGSRVGTVIDYDKYKEEWLEWVKQEAPSSVHKYKPKLDKYLSGRKINTPEELRKVVDQILKVKPDRHALYAIRSFIKFLEKTGRLRRSQAEDFRAVVPNIRTRERAESEKAVTPEQVIRAYNSITGRNREVR